MAGLGRDLPAAAHGDRRRSRPAPARSRARLGPKCCGSSRRGCGCRTAWTRAPADRGRADRRAAVRRRSAAHGHDDPARAPRARPAIAHAARVGSAASAPGRRGRRGRPIARRRLLAECEQEFWADIHPEFMTMHELASDLPCECVHFLVVRLRRSVLVDALRHADASLGWQLEHLETLGAGVPPAPPDAADVPVRAVRRRAAALAAEVAGPPARRWPQVFAEYPDARVIHTHRDPRQLHRVAREPARGVAVHAQRPRSTSPRSGR